MPVRRLDQSDKGFHEAFASLLNAKRSAEANVDLVVAEILSAVRGGGDQAILEFTHRFDRLDLQKSEMAFSKVQLQEARNAASPEQVEALEHAARRITAYHERQKPEDWQFEDEAGFVLGSRWTPVDAAGLYVPGGIAAYPSSVLMNAIPAKVAGVERLVMVVPTPDGQVNNLVLAAADIVGVDEIFRIGGAQAIGALAYGTESIAPVDKIVGPGNAYVASAKKQVFGVVGIDMIAGPSEILVVADDSGNPSWIAADLLSQAEHDPTAQSILITDSNVLADQVVQEVEDQLQNLPREAIARDSWETFGAVIVVQDVVECAPLIDKLAPEHLELAMRDAADLGARVKHAGAIFYGHFVPEAVGDYIGGPNHVLPTSQAARFSSGLGVLDFMKRTSTIEGTSDALRSVGPDAIVLAQAEGLDAHARSIGIRLESEAAGDDG